MPKRKRSPSADMDEGKAEERHALDPTIVQPRDTDVLFGRGDSINRYGPWDADEFD